ncbi:MAG: mechanosensitive ion channel [Gemmatimonadetes bacterium]|jgi:miniconductance mechanosensitive channel|nr:mechanosensitive ion channel [Gemmatimonadota bacterium]MBT5451562.1 mechanosensitive ion channel [Gemmatimonadota bacterium]MBT6620535.1 mechanosensitive ion channel [Gemmatimonadota bacterium]MBT7421968.1 mechanosensitive ion channel [Gemmatimonadota bacterium]MBT7551784.1 mechanosensitive ion channel [Gemmatimonadota bacterium]
MLNILQQILLELGLGEDFAATGARTGVSILVALAALIAHRLARGPVLRTIDSLIRRTNTDWDDALIERRVLHRLAHLVPGLVIYRLAPLALVGHARLQEIADTGVQIYLVLTSMLVIDALMSTTVDIYRSTKTSREISIKGLIQFLKVILYFLCGVFVVSVLLGKSPFYLLSGLTALTAVLLLIFRDAILGLVAGIQLSVNRMVARGDWIEMPKYGADGDVLDVTLTTVKVQNWDKTITTIPTYSLISESFKNWRGMQDSGGRRIKRSVHIDISTVKFLDEQMIERFGKIQYITDHIEHKKQELAEYNELNQVDLSHLANGRRMTNVGTFRAYVEAYLKNHPQISQEMTFLVRQLAPTPKGLPIEIYVFCKDKVWANYEAIQGDIFDHILAIIPIFDLQAFQEPAGKDFRGLNPAD